MISMALPALELCCLFMDKLVQLSALVSPQSMCILEWRSGRGWSENLHSHFTQDLQGGAGVDPIGVEYNVQFCLSVSLSAS